MTDVDDWYDKDDYQGKEEPDCYTCSDAGCPACGQVDPADPEHQRYVAQQILLARAAEGRLGQVVENAEIDAVALCPDATAEQLAAIRELVCTGVVTTTVSWPDPAATDEMPF